MLHRNITDSLLAALSDTPVVALHGARQAGKSTLAKAIADGPHPATYYTLDDAAVLGAAVNDPAGFVSSLRGSVVLDEIQRAPDLLLALKANVDRDRTPGRFLVTGSAQLMALPRLADTLAGRIEVLTLHPFTQSELAETRECLIDRLYSDEPLIAPVSVQHETTSAIVQRILSGGFPEPVLSRSTQPRRDAWFRSYIVTATERTVRDVAAIAGLPDLRRLLAAVAYRSGSLVNLADLSRTLAMPRTTVSRYLALLELAFLVRRLPAWSVNVTTRLVKSPKVFVADSGLLSHLVGATSQRLGAEPTLLGQLLESFVVTEIDRESGWSSTRIELFHFRTHVGREVDLVLEDVRGRLVGIEVKATSSPGAGDFKGLRALAEAAGERFHRGVVLSLAPGAVPYGDRLQTLPVAQLWGDAESA